MSAASLLKVYDGQDPELAFLSAGPGVTPDLTEVLTAGANAGAIAITNAGNITGNTSATLAISSGAGEGLALAGAVGASLVATTGGCKVEASEGVLELNWNGTGGQLNIIPVGAQFDATPIASGKPNWIAAQQLSVQVNGTNYWIPMSTTKFA